MFEEKGRKEGDGEKKNEQTGYAARGESEREKRKKERKKGG